MEDRMTTEDRLKEISQKIYKTKEVEPADVAFVADILSSVVRYLMEA